MQSRPSPLVLAGFLVAGCQDAAKVSLAAGGAVEIDTYCDNGGCDDANPLEVVVTVKADNNPSASVEIHQYRVDYEIAESPDLEGTMPYFAAETSLTVTAGEPDTFHLAAAGGRQRSWVLDQIGFGRVDGTATITLAGYNDDDELVQADTTFDIAFGDFSAGAGEDAGTTTDGGTP